MFTPARAGSAAGGGGVSTIRSPYSITKRKRQNEEFITKRMNRSPTMGYSEQFGMGFRSQGGNTTARVRTMKKVDGIAQIWIESGTKLKGLMLTPLGDFICTHEGKLIVFVEILGATISPIIVECRDFDMQSALTSLSIDETTGRKYVLAVDKFGNGN